MCYSSRGQGWRDRTPVHSSKADQIMDKPLQGNERDFQRANQLTLARAHKQQSKKEFSGEVKSLLPAAAAVDRLCKADSRLALLIDARLYSQGLRFLG